MWKWFCPTLLQIPDLETNPTRPDVYRIEWCFQIFMEMISPENRWPKIEVYNSNSIFLIDVGGEWYPKPN